LFYYYNLSFLLLEKNQQLANCEADQLCQSANSSATLAQLDNPFEHSGELYTLLLETGAHLTGFEICN
jgi:hypothetical protein